LFTPDTETGKGAYGIRRIKNQNKLTMIVRSVGSWFLSFIGLFREFGGGLAVAA
jgi:hypothetical protein